MTPKESNRPRSNRTALLGGLAWAVLVVLIPAVPLVTLAGPVAAADGGGAAASQGEKIFADQKCSTCHDLSTMDVKAKVKEGSATYGGDLAGRITDETDRDATAAFIRGETEHDGQKHKKKVSLDDGEMAALLDWLATQKAD
jgi:cytochrome c553